MLVVESNEYYFRKMKKQFWSLLIGITISLLGSAQPYKPLLDDFNEWHFTTCFSGCNTSDYYTDGDTVVDGITHKILDGYHYISRSFLLHEDTADRKVYLTKVNPVKTDHFLLYDFSKHEGDTMELFNPNSPFMTDPGTFILDSIRLRPLEDGNAYRHFYWSPAAGNTTSVAHPVWVEGVGSLSLINAAGGQPDFNTVGQLSCFFKNSTSFYVNLDSITSCEPVHVLSVEEMLSPDWNIYPVPVSGELKLSKAFPGQTYAILNLSGTAVVTGILDQDEMIRVDTLDPGTYFLKIGTQHFRKFSKME